MITQRMISNWECRLFSASASFAIISSSDEMARQKKNHLQSKAPLLFSRKKSESEKHQICEVSTGSRLKSHQTPRGLTELGALKLSRRVIAPKWQHSLQLGGSPSQFTCICAPCRHIYMGWTVQGRAVGEETKGEIHRDPGEFTGLPEAWCCMKTQSSHEVLKRCKVSLHIPHKYWIIPSLSAICVICNNK